MAFNYFTTTAAAILVTGMSALGVSAQSLTLAHQYPETQPIGDGYDLWAERVEEMSDGEITVQVFPGSTLIGSSESFAAVQSGSVSASNMIGGFQVGDIPELAVLGLPFMYDDYDHYRRAVDAGLFEMVQGWYEEKGIKLLNMFPKGSVQVFHKDKFLLEPADYEGAQIRGVGGAASAALTALGANEVRLPTTEVTPALQRGVVDGIITNCVAHIGRSWYEQTPYVSVVAFANDMEGLGMNLGVWNSFTEEQQTMMLEAAKEMEDYEWEMMRRVEQTDCFDDWEELGVNVKVATDEQRAALKAALEPVIDDYAEDLPVLNEIRALLDEVR